MDKKELTIRQIPCVLYGAPAKRVFVYVHGKCGCKEEAEAFAGNVTSRGYQVLAMDLPGHGHRKAEAERFVPWEVAPELGRIYDAIRESYEAVSLYAGSIGAYFSLLGFPEGAFRRVLLAAPYDGVGIGDTETAGIGRGDPGGFRGSALMAILSVCPGASCFPFPGSYSCSVPPAGSSDRTGDCGAFFQSLRGTFDGDAGCRAFSAYAGAAGRIAEMDF